MSEKRTIEERVQAIEDSIKAVKVGWWILKILGYIGMAIAAIWTSFHGVSSK